MSRFPAPGLVLVLLLAGCTVPPDVTPAPSVAATSAPGPVAAPSGDLLAQRAAAGIPDCPASDASARPVPGGLPDVELACLGGGTPVHLAGLRGRPMMINLWAQWCGPCRTEAPYLAAVARASGRAITILGVDYADPRPDYAIEFARAAGWRYPQLADPDLALRGPLQIAGPPQTFFVRADGTIAYRHLGPFTSVTQIKNLARSHLGVSW